MTQRPNPTWPPELGNVQRPRAGSWLDKSARRIGEILSDEYGVTGFDSDAAYLAFAEDLRVSRAGLAQQFHITPASAQRYIGEDALASRAAKIAESLGGENIGGDPFADPDTVPVRIEVWTHVMWSFHIAAQVSKSANEEYAWALTEIAGSMTGVLAKQLDTAGGALLEVRAPRAGMIYAARVAAETSEAITTWDLPPAPVTPEQLAYGLRTDARDLNLLLG